jgi:hypothetical protein
MVHYTPAMEEGVMGHAISCAASLALMLVCTAGAEQGAPAPSPGMFGTQAQEATAAEAERTAQLRECRASQSAKVAQYQKLMAARDYWTSTLQIRACAELLDDSALRALVAEGEVKSYVQDIESPKIGAFDRIRSIEALARINPQRAKKYEQLVGTLTSTLEQQHRDYHERNRVHSRAERMKWLKMISFPSRTLQDWTVEKALLEAQADLRKGKPKLYVSGTIGAYTPAIRLDQSEKLKDLPYAEAGIGCLVEDDQLRQAQFDYAVAYNRHVAEHYRRR